LEVPVDIFFKYKKGEKRGKRKKGKFYYKTDTTTGTNPKYLS
jgi:hypothetical protein